MTEEEALGTPEAIRQDAEPIDDAASADADAGALIVADGDVFLPLAGDSPEDEPAAAGGENRDSPSFSGEKEGEEDGVPENGENAIGSDDVDEDDSGEGDAVGGETDPELRMPFASVVEAILFAASEPLKLPQIARAVGKGTRQDAVREAIAELNLFYLETARAYEILEISGRYQLMSRPEYAEHLARICPRREAAEKRGVHHLTPAAIETLSIVAYKQPVARAEIERIRGVGCGPVIRTLIERGLVRISGRLDVVGKPPLYSTTEALLVELGLGSVDEIPLRNNLLNAFPEVFAADAPASEPEPAGKPVAPVAEVQPSDAERVEENS
ncbi:MAG: SMC-Scp complex subunit ScpB [Planctomycetota bacterium]|jgi:segregation and condensation protein B|nr:SMC-Scp complex subunit ScpB [Planctomycetota bacterium]